MIPIIGLMSGTSMDGINGTIVETDGVSLKRTNISTILKYQKQTKLILLEAINSPTTFIKNKSLKCELDNLIAIDHASTVKSLLKRYHSTPKYIGFHGQTILHNPRKKITIQLGNSDLLSNLTGIDVISDFRMDDILAGGQGAPLAPIYHLNIMKEMKLELPSIIINIGGVSNLTYYNGDDIIGFDIGPGNGLMDIFVQSNFDVPFDKNGDLAKKGKFSQKLVKKFEDNQFFQVNYPKSIDRLHFKNIYNVLLKANLSHYDTLSTLLEFTVSSIKIAISQLPKFPKNLIVVGGGQHNNFLIDRLKNVLKLNIFTSNQVKIPGDMIEAELIAYIGIRSLKKLPYTFPTTTGVKKHTCGGIIYKFNKFYNSES